MKGLYIHIPFCDHICSYCDFLKAIAKTDIKEKYVDALVKEIKEKISIGSINNINTIYIGGGTPTSLSIELLGKVLDALDLVYSRNDILEYTIEANPKDIREEMIELLIRHNINRISLGVQSFDNDKLKVMRRNHDKNIAIDAIKLCKKNFSNVSVDFIYGFENDNFLLMKNDILKAHKLGVNHISCYSLIIEDKTILNFEEEQGRFNPMDEDRERELYDKITDYLESLGYKHYEVSNYAKEGYESIHNKIYWRNEFYEACGVGASSYVHIRKDPEDNSKDEFHRIRNITSINAYITAFNKYTIDLKDIISEDINCDLNDRIDNEIYLRFRMKDGLDKKEFIKRFGTDIRTKYPKISELIQEGYLIETIDHIFVAPDYIYVSDAIIMKMFPQRVETE